METIDTPTVIAVSLLMVAAYFYGAWRDKMKGK